MAIIEKTSNLGNGAEFTFQYDDVSMQLVGISVDNKSKQDLYIEMFSPKAWAETFEAGVTTVHNILESKSPKWSWKEVASVEFGTEYKISGIEWLAGMRN